MNERWPCGARSLDFIVPFAVDSVQESLAAAKQRLLSASREVRERKGAPAASAGAATPACSWGGVAGAAAPLAAGAPVASELMWWDSVMLE